MAVGKKDHKAFNIDFSAPSPTEANGEVHARKKKTETAPGMMADVLMAESSAIKENMDLKTRLEDFDGALPTRKIDSRLVVRSKWANRHEQSFLDNEFLELKSDIESNGGNVQAIKVRPLAGQNGKYEVVFGHRRHQACLDLGLPVLAMIEDLTEQDLFVQMDRENRDRKDLRPYEQGLMYAKALDAGLFPSARKMAEKLGVDLTNFGKALAIARLPDPILNAFHSPLDIQFRWASDLKDAVEKNPDFVLRKAEELVQMSPKPDAKKVFAMLLGSENTLQVTPDTEVSDFKGKHGESAVLVIDRIKKSATLKFKGLDDTQTKKINGFIKELLKS